MKIVFTEQFLLALQNNLDFLSETGLNTKQIIIIREKILNSIALLEQHPERGQIEPYLEHLNLKHRRIVVDYYKIIYRVAGHYVYVTDLFDGRQDPEKLLKRV